MYRIVLYSWNVAREETGNGFIYSHCAKGWEIPEVVWICLTSVYKNIVYIIWKRLEIHSGINVNEISDWLMHCDMMHVCNEISCVLSNYD